MSRQIFGLEILELLTTCLIFYKCRSIEVLQTGQQRLVALEPDRGFGPVDPGAQEGRDGRAVARAGEAEQGRFGGGLCVVVLLVLAVALAAGPDDPPLFVTPEVGLALPMGEGAGGELFNQALIMGAQALYLEAGECGGRLLSLLRAWAGFVMAGAVLYCRCGLQGRDRVLLRISPAVPPAAAPAVPVPACVAPAAPRVGTGKPSPADPESGSRERTMGRSDDAGAFMSEGEDAEATRAQAVGIIRDALRREYDGLIDLGRAEAERSRDRTGLHHTRVGGHVTPTAHWLPVGGGRGVDHRRPGRSGDRRHRLLSLGAGTVARPGQVE